jgi:hypothetical protein
MNNKRKMKKKRKERIKKKKEDLALGSNQWCLTSVLTASECSRQIDKVSRFHTLRVSGSNEICLFMYLSGLHSYWDDFQIYFHYHWKNIDS